MQLSPAGTVDSHFGKALPDSATACHNSLAQFPRVSFGTHPNPGYTTRPASSDLRESCRANTDFFYPFWARARWPRRARGFQEAVKRILNAPPHPKPRERQVHPTARSLPPATRISMRIDPVSPAGTLLFPFWEGTPLPPTDSTHRTCHFLRVKGTFRRLALLHRLRWRASETSCRSLRQTIRGPVNEDEARPEQNQTRRLRKR
jgi:hypothetical protein